MPPDPPHRMEDWMRLILLNWVLISFVMFYSILAGALGGALAVLACGTALEWAGVSIHHMRLYPSPGSGAAVVIGGLIASLFIHLFSHLRYHCASGSYTLDIGKAANSKSLFRLASAAFVLVGIGAGIEWLLPR